MVNTLSKVPDRGDPSDVLQLFPRFNLQLLCCRYWWLRHWEFRELSFPYWRIYHNSHEGAVIIYNGTEYALRADKILMIAPNTSYSTRIGDFLIPENAYHIEGGRLGKGQSEESYIQSGCILHLFIHFNIGVPYDNVSPGVFEFELTDHLQEKLFVIKKHLNEDFAKFNFYTVLAIQALISDLLSFIPESNWDLMSKDYRIIHVLAHIESNLNRTLSNDSLADQASMACNAFNRLFTEELGVSPQRFVKKKRIDKACALLHHSSYSIEQVAAETGFADRYHFSKIFKHLTGLSPARYRKEFSVK
ncbi:MAG: AraC family transcriptional regulator [Bacteroides sp.]|nr:AraC family transcriptional regulator [Bacteroides sp.]